MVPRVGNETLRPLGVAIGERRQRDPCLKHTYIKICKYVGRRLPMTSLPARPQYKGRRENTSFDSSSEACVRSMAHSLGDAVSRSPLRGTVVIYVTCDVPLHGNFELRPLGVAIGERYTHATMLRRAQANFMQKASTKPTPPG